jgi:uncharacterized damage-inducible protein DinB
VTSAQLLTDAFGRIREVVHAVVDGLSPAELEYRPGPDANSIAWLVWHLTRVQDDHVAAAFDGEQVWTSGGWADRFGLPFEVGETGWSQRTDEVAQVRVESGELLTAYHDAVYQRTADIVLGLVETDLSRVVDQRYDPPVTLAARLVSVIADDLQHAGQAAYVRGLLP